MANESAGNTMTAVGAVAGGLLGAAVANGLGAALGPDFMIRVIAGGLVGWLCGLIPYFAGRSKDLDFARKAVWVCVGAGMVLGVILALPVGVVSGVMAARRSPTAVVGRGMPAS